MLLLTADYEGKTSFSVADNLYINVFSSLDMLR